MDRIITRRSAGLAAGAALAVAAAVVVVPAVSHGEHDKFPWKAKELVEYTQGEADGGAGDESAEAKTAAEQFDQHRFAGGIVAPGAYGAAYSQLTGLTRAGSSTWTDTTKKPYDADDPAYRDYYSNSSGGSGNVTGRITGIATDGTTVYAAGADGGVFRSTSGTGSWTPISDQLPSLSTGDLRVQPRSHNLWLATGEANTGGTSYVGSGVYRLADADKGGSFTPADRVGGTELESTVIQKVRFSTTDAFVATNRGIFKHSLSGDVTAAWTQVYAPNPDYLPGGTKASDPSAAYKNIVNDVAVDPNNEQHVIAAVGWRGGDTYNGFYESTRGGAKGTWHLVNLKGGIDSLDSTDVGFATLAYSADGSKLYAVVQSIALYNKASGTVNSYLKGVYVSGSGSVEGPFTKIADSQKLANSGSALKQSTSGKGYGPGIQSWYNQFLQVDPANPQHLWVGLEEVYETKNGGSSWNTVGPYWNFYFSCWDYTKFTTFAGCNQTTHPDQHSAAVGLVGKVPTVFVGNDGGIYSRPVDGKVDQEGHATDWTSLNDGSIDALQYYGIGIGTDPDNGGFAVSGGLQDNGGSVLRGGAATMSSNFGGDGGDVLVDPANGCNIVQEYVYLSMRVTNNCAHSTTPDAFVDPAKASTFDIAPPDSAVGAARFIAPFDADRSDYAKWIAAGRHVYTQGNGFKIRSGSEWAVAFDLGAGHTATAVAMNNGKAAVAWCGPCNNAGFTRGIAVGTYGDPSSWHQVDVSALPARYIGGLTVTPTGDVYAAVGGFSRRFTEGPGAGYGHVFELPAKSTTWTSLDLLGSGTTPVAGVSFPDVPASSVKVSSTGVVYVGTDLGVVVRQPTTKSSTAKWQLLGSGLPLTTVMDVEQGPDGTIYAGTHGRGIWQVPAL